MRKLGLVAVILLVASLALIPRSRPASLPAAPAPPTDKTMTFRIVFGSQQAKPEDVSGSVTLSAGRVVHVLPWRFFGGDAINPDGSWKLHIKRTTFENQPFAPAGVDSPEPVLNLVPEGVEITVEAPPTARAHVRAGQAEFTVELGSLDYHHPIAFLGGDAEVERTPTAQQISPVPEGPHPEEHDYPSVCVTRQGTVWMVWQAYQNLGDSVYARYSTPTGWSEPFRLTSEKGDVFHTAVAEDSAGKVWVVWSERTGEDWDLYARSFDGKAWTPQRKLTTGNHPNFFHRLIADGRGTLRLVWVGYQGGQSHVFLSTLRGDEGTEPTEVSGPSAWMPDAASDAAGNLYIAWDSYRTGNYQIFLRKVNVDGSLEPVQQVTHSGKFHAHSSLAVDRAGRVWLAWDESGDNWGKDWNVEDQTRGTTLYASRSPRVAVLENGVWKQPIGDLRAAIPARYNQFVEAPHLVCDARGRIWMALQIRTSAEADLTDHWANNGRWEHFFTSYEGDHWNTLTPVPETSSRPDGTFQMASGPQSVWMAWVNDNRPFGPAAEYPPQWYSASRPPQGMVMDGTGAHRPWVEEVDAADAANPRPAPPPQLDAFTDPAIAAPPIHPQEADDVARIRAYRTTLDGHSLRILRGDFHRHTEISHDGAGDGSVEDYFRYMLDAAAMDTGIISDHNSGGDNEYSWWRIEKAIDLFHIRDFYTPLFGYERSVPYPNGHRNMVFAQRGVRTVPISDAERQGKVSSGSLVFPYLKQNRGICMMHSMATEQGTDYRDIDPEVQPLVEIYQGFHANYEYEGAPRAESSSFHTPVHGKYEPAGFFWNALEKGYKLGIESSSDHISTHSSYTLIYSPSTDRTDIVDSMRQRHVYGATDNIIVDFQAVDAEGRVHLMGDAFPSTAAPRLKVKVIGTDTLARVEIIKDGKFVFTASLHDRTADFTYVDNEPPREESWYYVRVIQMDRNLAWSSPIWVDYRHQ